MSVNKDYIIGLDIGTSSTKSIVRRTDGVTKMVFQQSYPIEQPLPGYSEQDPDLILAAVKQGISRAVEEMEGPPAAISFSSAMHSIMALDAGGKPLTPLIIWADNRSEGCADRIKASPEGGLIYRQTGTPIHAMSPLPKLCWLKEEQPGIFSRSAMFLGIKEYILYHLLGEYYVDHSIASATGMFDIHTLKWNETALKMAGVKAGQLPRPVSADHLFPGILPERAVELGIPAATPIIIGGSDGCLAQLGSRAMDPGHATLTIGTSGAMRMAGSSAKVDERQRLFTYLLTDDVYISGGATNNGGVVIQWMVEQLFRLPVQQLGELVQAALETEPDHLICLPYLFGERAPIWDSSASASFIGIRQYHDNRHFIRAAIEGICFALLSIREALTETIGPVNKVSVSGGFTSTPGWIQLLANIFEQEMYCLQSGDASAEGAILLAAKVLGWETGLWEVQEPLKVYYPDLKHKELYRENFRRYKQLYELIKTKP
jgi:gluconokinase